MVVLGVSVVLTAQAATDPAWWNQNPYRPPAANPKAAELPLISVRGNRFVTPDGHPILFRGVSIADPDKLVGQGQWNQAFFAAVKEYGATLVRIPVHPTAWRHHGPAEYLQLLDQAVDWCADLHLYVIIDWHSIGNLMTGMFQDPMYDTSQTETFDFWRRMAQHFTGNHTVAFFELFNEPTDYRGQLGDFSWTAWRNLNEQMIGIIRAFDNETIPLVAGDDWAYDLDQVHYEPIRAANIGYVTHPYPMKRTRPWEPKWDEDFGFVADHYPMIATEIGFWTKPGDTVTDDSYGNRITRYLESRGISWMAWVFDPQWDPSLIKSFNGFPLTPAGEFFKQALHRPAVPVGVAAGGPQIGVGQLEPVTASGVTVSIEKDGRMFFNGEEVADDQLSPDLAGVRSANAGVPVTIIIDEAADIKRLEMVMDTCRRLGLTRLVIHERGQ